MPKIKLCEDLTPISEFRLRTAELVAKVKKNRRPLILTQHGPGLDSARPCRPPRCCAVHQAG